LYAAPESAPDVVVAVAREFSPRIEIYGPTEVGIDLHGVSRLFGEAREVGHELRRTAADHKLRVRVAIASTRTTARLIVRHRAGVTVVDAGTEAATLAPLPLALLAALAANPESQIPNPKSPLSTIDDPPTDVLRQWGLKTLGEFAALPADAVAARLGQAGVAWQRVAAGEDPRPLVPAVPEERFEQALDLEWPIEGLEPLSFVLGRLIEPLSAHLERRDRGAAVLHVRLHLVTREVHERSLQLPVAMRDARTLRTLALLDLESHPPAAAIDRVIVAVDPTPGRIVQYSLLTRPLPSPEQVSTLMARLNALMGDGRCGSPAPVDSWQPGAFAMQPFAPAEVTDSHPHGPQRHGGTEDNKDLSVSVPLWPVAVKDAGPVVALRRFRFPVPARVRVENGKPARVTTDRRGLYGGRVETCSGPWRTSGAWWEERGGRWDGDEWDVALSDGASYRLFRERDADHWFVAGVID
jgi:protein ImuB